MCIRGISTMDNAAVSSMTQEDKKAHLTKQISLVAVGIILTAITTVVAYFAITKGLALQDMALTSTEKFYSTALLYVGGSFAIAAAVNIFVTGARALYYDKVPAGYESARLQVAATLLAPLALPVAFCGSAALGMGGR